MNKGSPENEEDKEVEKATGKKNSEVYENEKAEDAEKSSQPQKALSSEKSLPPNSGEASRSFSRTESEDRIAAEIEQKKREKWLTLTGKRPRNIPVIKRYCETEPDQIILFGERRQLQVEKKIAERMALAAKKLSTKGRNLGKVKKEIWLPALCNGLMCIRFEPNAQTLATSDRNGGTQIRKPHTGEIILNLKTIEASERLAVKALRYHPRHTLKLYAGGEAGIIQVFNKDSGVLLSSSTSITPINCMDISSGGSFLVTGGREGKVHVIDPKHLKVISIRAWPVLNETTPPEVSDQFHRLRVYGAKFHPEDENLFITGSYDSVKIWDVRVPTAIRSINGPAIFGEGLDISNNTILTAAWQAENSIGLWDFTSGKLIKYVPIKNHYTKLDGEFLFAGQFFKSNPSYPTVSSNFIAVGGGGFTQLLVINTKNEKVSAHFPSYKSIFCLDLVGNLVAYGGKESVFRIGEVE